MKNYWIIALAILTTACPDSDSLTGSNTGSGVDTSKELVTVFSYGSLQCQAPKPLAESKEQIELLGLTTYHSRCGRLTSAVLTALCGDITGELHLHDIALEDVQQAEMAGFDRVTTLQDGADNGFEEADCLASSKDNSLPNH